MRLPPSRLAWTLSLAAALALPAGAFAQNQTVPFPVIKPPLDIPVPPGKCALDEANAGERALLEKKRRQLAKTRLDAGKIIVFFDCARIAEARRTRNFDISASGLAVVNIKDFNYSRTGVKNNEFGTEQCNILRQQSGELTVAGTAEWKAELLRQTRTRGENYLPVVHHAARACYSALVDNGDVSFVAFLAVRGIGLMIVTTNYEQQDPQGLIAHFELLRGYTGMLARANPVRRLTPGASAPAEPPPPSGSRPPAGEAQQRAPRQ